MENYLLLILSVFTLSVLFISLLIKYSSILGLQDVPNSRSAHKRIIPRSAGLGFVSAVLISLLVFDFDHLVKFYYIYMSILGIMFVGIYDDKFGVSPRIKFLGLALIALFVCSNGTTISNLGTYIGITINLPIYIISIFSIIAIVGFTNALNLMDGLDGLAGGLTLVMLLTFFTIGLTHNDELMIMLSGLFTIATITFLLFNWYPAKIFMGDSGSLSLGFVISILSIQSLEYMVPSSVLFIIALPLIDTFIVIRRRLQRGQSPFKADKNHLHHFLYKTKLNVKFSVILLLYIQLALSIIGYQLKSEDQILSLVLFALLLFIFLNLFDQRFVYREKKKKSSKK